MIVKCSQKERDEIIKQAMEMEENTGIIREGPEYIDVIRRGLESNMKYLQLQRIKNIIKGLEIDKMLEEALSNESYLSYRNDHQELDLLKLGNEIIEWDNYNELV